MKIEIKIRLPIPTLGILDIKIAINFSHKILINDGTIVHVTFYPLCDTIPWIT